MYVELAGPELCDRKLWKILKTEGKIEKNIKNYRNKLEHLGKMQRISILSNFQMTRNEYYQRVGGCAHLNIFGERSNIVSNLSYLLLWDMIRVFKQSKE